MVGRTSRVLGKIAVTAAVLGFVLPSVSLADPKCPDAMEYPVEVPLWGSQDWNSQWQKEAEAVLAQNGVPAAEWQCIIDVHKEKQDEAVKFSKNNPIAKELETCMEDWKEQNGSVSTIGAYIAKLESSEAHKKEAAPCKCALKNLPYPFNLITLDASNLTPQSFTICNNGLYALGLNDYICPNVDHLWITVQSQASLDLNGNVNDVTEAEEEDYFSGTQVAAGYDLCNFGVTVEAHRQQHSCFAPGTRIRMGDGSLKKVEQIQAGDKVWNPLRQKAVTVRKKVVGAEPIPLIEVQFGGSTIRVSQRHPFLMPHHAASSIKQASLSNMPKSSSMQVRLANELEIGDEILTAEGKLVEVTSVRELPVTEDQQVYNFSLDAPGTSLEEHAVVADGAVTGDYNIQLEVNRRLSH